MFADLTDAYGRPILVRPSAIAAIEGARDPGDPHGDLWAQHPIHPYRKVILHSGLLLYLADVRGLIDQLCPDGVYDRDGLRRIETDASVPIRSIRPSHA